MVMDQSDSGRQPGDRRQAASDIDQQQQVETGASHAEKHNFCVSETETRSRGVAMDPERSSKGLSLLSSVPAALLGETRRPCPSEELREPTAAHTGPSGV